MSKNLVFKSGLVVFILFFFLAVTSAGAAEENGVVGTVMEIEGAATINSRPIEIHSPVLLNDLIETGPASRLFVLFIDDTEMTLSENTQLRVDEYVFDADNAADNKGVYSVLKGAFLYMSGLMAKTPDPDVVIQTPVGAIGIRGTEFWGGDIDGEYGVLVNEGRVNITTDAGETLLDKGQGTSIRGRRFMPAAGKPWAKDKMDRAVNTVFLQRREMVRKRITENRQRQHLLRDQYKETLKARRQKTPELRQENKRELPRRTEQDKGRLHQKLQERREDGQSAPFRQRPPQNRKRP